MNSFKKEYIFCMEHLFHNFWIWYVLNFEKAEEVRENNKAFEKIFSTSWTTEIFFLFFCYSSRARWLTILSLEDTHTHTSVYMIELFSLFWAAYEVGDVLSAGVQAFFYLLRASVSPFCFLFPTSERASTFENPSRKYHFPIRYYHSLIWRNRKEKKKYN